MFESIQKFIGYWYFRYLLVTELYMVEKWERVMIRILFLCQYSISANEECILWYDCPWLYITDIVFFVLFSVISLFNNYVVLNLVSYFLQSVLPHASNLTIVRELPDPDTLFETEFWFVRKIFQKEKPKCNTVICYIYLLL